MLTMGSRLWPSDVNAALPAPLKAQTTLYSRSRETARLPGTMENLPSTSPLKFTAVISFCPVCSCKRPLRGCDRVRKDAPISAEISMSPKCCDDETSHRPFLGSLRTGSNKSSDIAGNGTLSWRIGGRSTSVSNKGGWIEVETDTVMKGNLTRSAPPSQAATYGSTSADMLTDMVRGTSSSWMEGELKASHVSVKAVHAPADAGWSIPGWSLS
mmetsp:Transcript_111197/g.215332  ORF Transcript_111197/g.215332 Transcript_111197/m.215332 type:complete len:213 (+) Transcript_111197:376-1014(+)